MNIYITTCRSMNVVVKCLCRICVAVVGGVGMVGVCVCRCRCCGLYCVTMAVGCEVVLI